MESQPSHSKSNLAKEAFVELLTECSRRGFYGSASVVLSFQDGHIQNVALTTERKLK